MNVRSLVAAAAIWAGVALPGMAAAQTLAYAVNDGYTNLREGPGTNYRVVALLYPGTRLEVLGCLVSDDWCDVVAQNVRGWVSTSRMEFDYSGRRVIVPDYAPSFDAPIIQFHFGNDLRRDRDRDHRRHRRDRDRRHDQGRGPDYGVSPPNQGTSDDQDFGNARGRPRHGQGYGVAPCTWDLCPE